VKCLFSRGPHVISQPSKNYPTEIYAHLYSHYQGSWANLRLVNRQSNAIVLQDHRTEYLKETAYRKLKQLQPVMRAEYFSGENGRRRSWGNYLLTWFNCLNQEDYLNTMDNTYHVDVFFDIDAALTTAKELFYPQKIAKAYHNIVFFLLDLHQNPKKAIGLSKKIRIHSIQFKTLETIFLQIVNDDKEKAHTLLDRLSIVKEEILDPYDNFRYQTRYVRLLAYLDPESAIANADMIACAQFRGKAHVKIAAVAAKTQGKAGAEKIVDRIENIPSKIAALLSSALMLVSENRGEAFELLRQAEALMAEVYYYCHRIGQLHVEVKTHFSFAEAAELAKKYHASCPSPRLFKKIALVQARKNRFVEAMDMANYLRGYEKTYTRTLVKIADLQPFETGVTTLRLIDDKEFCEEKLVSFTLSQILIDPESAKTSLSLLRKEENKSLVRRKIRQANRLFHTKQEKMRKAMEKCAEKQTVTDRFEHLIDVLSFLLLKK